MQTLFVHCAEFKQSAWQTPPGSNSQGGVHNGEQIIDWIPQEPLGGVSGQMEPEVQVPPLHPAVIKPPPKKQ
ncbi:hypothetical protein J4220_00695, partial [Candidatus Micrarchaeota archaeon]|nr:hypothetical protein [Candidatus Micrarchaeota archaeon]